MQNDKWFSQCKDIGIRAHLSSEDCDQGISAAVECVDLSSHLYELNLDWTTLQTETILGLSLIHI